MPSVYNPSEIEKKWQVEWEKTGLYTARDLKPAQKNAKFYGLVEFPYPSGEGLHVGHPRSYTALDIMTRKRRMEGKNVMYPIGWDAFGLPTENFAIKNKVKPQDATRKNVANFTRQLKSLGFGFDWSREVNTTDPEYYRWTQWMFLKFYSSYYDEKTERARPIAELKGDEAYLDSRRMAYKAKTTINWCPSCKIGLANEEAQGGVCERCGGKVEKREKEQWMIRITAYAERLLEDLGSVDYLERIKAQQINWIGKSEGALIDFEVADEKLTVFTTRPDTIFGVTYMVLSPDHALVDKWLEVGTIKNAGEVKKYRETTRKKTEIERQENKEKTGVVLKGVVAVNPATKEEISVWIADYVLSSYGTGAIMAVPAHDERDGEFARAFDLSSKVVNENGIVLNSDFLNGLEIEEAKKKMSVWLEKEKVGKRATTYKLRDWVFSRQRYWGEPIPIVFCEKCGTVPIPDEQLPVLLPEVDAYEPTETGESPLAGISDWVNVDCPSCGGKAKRETDTMPNWAGSSWYFLRYCDPHNSEKFADPEKLKFWMPVDLYNGGMEHTTLHLLYSRFWYKFFWDLGFVPKECGAEPYAKRRSHGLILGEGGVKMSKSKGNVVNPDDVVAQYGADVFRLYEMFIGPFDMEAPWDTNGIEGIKRFVEKVWRLFSVTGTEKAKTSSEVETLLNQTIKKVGEDIETMNFNTAVSSLMILVNGLSKNVGAIHELPRPHAEILLKLLAPFAPHVAEELWQSLGHKTSIHVEPWPKFDVSKLEASTFELVFQVNGKVRDRVVVDADITEEEATAKALASDKVQASLGGKKPQKIVYVKGRLVSISF